MKPSKYAMLDGEHALKNIQVMKLTFNIARK
jgi:hypothetical protein